MKTKSFFAKHRYAVACFLFVVLYNYLIVNRLSVWKITEITFAYHVVDYSLGFRSQLLPGAVFYGIFGEHASETVASVYETVLLLLFFVGISFLLERFLRRVDLQQRNAALFLILFYLTGPFTFAIFTDELGMLDVYWLFFSLLFFFVLEKRGLRFLIPVLFALSLLVHFSSVLNYLILFSTLLLYRISIEPQIKQKKLYFLIFILSLAVTGSLFLYFLFNHVSEMPLTREEFHSILESRGSDYFIYYDYAFYNAYYETEVVSASVFAIASPFLRIMYLIFEKCRFTFESYALHSKKALFRLIFTVALLAPVTCFFYRQFCRLFQSAKGNRLKRFCIFLMMVQFPFTAVLGCLFSPDIIRWSTHAFLIFFSMLLYLLYREDTIREQTMEDIEKYRSFFVVWAYTLAYSFANAWAYC